jgi:TonB family protein
MLRRSCLTRLPFLVVLAPVVLLLAACAAARQPVPPSEPAAPPEPAPVLDSLPEAKIPRALSSSEPTADIYPASARRAFLQGRVLVEFGIGPSGRAIGARVTKEEPAGVFGRSALSIINGYRFPANTPATQKYRLSVVYVLDPCPHKKPCEAPEPFPTMNYPITVTGTPIPSP